MNNYYIYETPIGKIRISDNGKNIIEITNIINKLKDGKYKETKLIKKAYNQLEEYFNGERKNFDLPLEFNGTEFQKKVWKALCNIPYGETKTYKEIAKEIECPKGARAVGMSNNKNKIMIVIPCHRVIGASGNLVGYAGGLNVKEYLLELEKDNI